MSQTGMTRRAFHRLTAGLAAGSSLLGTEALAAAAAQEMGGPRPLPRRENVVIRGAFIMTMDAAGDMPESDIHIVDGRIVAVGRNLAAPGAEVIQGRGKIVLPGLVETHWHMWNTLLRSMSGDKSCCGYFPTSAKYGLSYTPHDMYCAVRLATAEALNAGITTIHDWCHNPLTPAHAEEDLRALRESGIRGRFSYGPARGLPITKTVDLADIRRLHGDWKSYSNEGLLSLGLAWRGVQSGTNAPGGLIAFQEIPRDVYMAEYTTARDLGIPMTAHINISTKIDVGHVKRLNEMGLLYKDLQLIHMLSSTPEEIAAVAMAGSPVSFSPYTEMRAGFGFSPATAFLEAGVPVGLSVDTTALSGDASMFEVMKGLINITNGLAQNEFQMPARQALEIGTIHGARSLGMDQEIGSLTPGKRADVIMIDPGAVNFGIGILPDPSHLVVEATQPANVELVMVDGRILKNRGKLTAIDVPQVIAEATAANAGLRQRVKL
jgi:5-methylthioadenosine/S-adenosylhomocysteine deaminase